jgi:DNA polymerase-3 subunit delta
MSSGASQSTSTKARRVYAIAGADPFRKREALAALCRQLADSEGADAPTRFDGDEAELADVLDEVRTFALLGGLRVVIVDDADGFITKHRQALERYCAEPADSGVLILVCKSMPANTKLAKIIATNGEVIRFEELKGAAVTGWITERARTAHGKKIEPAAAARLRDLIGSELGLLDAELSKLAIYARERPVITANDVEELVGRTREEEIWGVLDALASGQTAKALRLWEQVLSTDRAAEHRSIAGLAWGVRKLLDLKLQAARGVPVSVLAKQAFTTPDVLSQRLKRVSVEDLQNQLEDLLDADLATKTGLAEASTAIERFLVKHSTTGSGVTAATTRR